MKHTSHTSTWRSRVCTEVIVYLVFSPEGGPAHCIYSDEDIQAAGGIHAIEQSLRRESYWFVPLGQIPGELGPMGVTVRVSDIALLTTPPEVVWRTGRRNPACGESELERQVFRATFQRIESMLESWKRLEDGVVLAFALKALRISTERLGTLTRALRILPRVHEIAEISVIEHWYDPDWPEPHLPCDLPLAEYTFKVPLEFRRTDGPQLLTVEVMTMALC